MLCASQFARGLLLKKLKYFVSACSWFIVKKAKIFWSYVNHFGILVGVRKYRILIVLCKKSFFELPNHISRLTSQNEVSASFFFLLLRLLEKIGSYRVLLFYTLFSLHFNKTKKNKLFYLHFSCETLLSNQVRKFKSQKYFPR